MNLFYGESWVVDIQETITAGKSAPAAPAAPDPTVTAAAQTASNVNTAEAQTALNDVNQVTPYGNSTYNQTGTTTTADGTQVPQYTQTTTLTPDSQAALTNEQALAKTLSGYGTQVAANNASNITAPIDFSSLPSSPTSLNLTGANAIPQSGDFQNEADQATQAAYSQAQGLIAPQQQYAQQQLASSLNNAGIPITSAAAQQQDNLLATQQAGQNNNLAEGAVGLGQSEQQTLANEALAGRGQQASEATTNAGLTNQAIQTGLQEDQLKQNQPINELAALLQGNQAIQSPSVANPSQTGISPTDTLGAQGLSQSANLAAYNAQVNSANAGNSAAAGLVAAGGTAAAIF